MEARPKQSQVDCSSGLHLHLKKIESKLKVNAIRIIKKILKNDRQSDTQTTGENDNYKLNGEERYWNYIYYTLLT